jgi:hypothetical protein
LSGFSVSLSADGSRVAIGAVYNDGSGIDSGHARVYEFSNNSWIKLGLDIDGESANDESGFSVSLSADGSRVAIGARKNDGSGIDSGHARVYELYTIPIGDICFVKGTPIRTDQGLINIDKINPAIHTIRNKPVVGITQSVYASNKYLICFEKDCLGNNIPSQKTVMSMNHKVFYKGNMICAKEFVGKVENVRRIKYKGEILYNVLMEECDKMLVNNLICETLDPDSNIAKLYILSKNMDVNKRNELIKWYNSRHMYRVKK